MDKKDILLPEHVAIIMDGNGRWAKQRGLRRTEGHKVGAEVFRTISKYCADIGINPQNDGSVIRLTFPPLTEDRRKELANDIQKIAENSKVAVRSIRRDAIEKLKAMKKNSEITEDDLKDGEKEIQKITDGFVKEVEDLAAAKEKEILTV